MLQVDEQDFSIAAVIRSQAEARPDDPCLTFRGETLTFGALHDRADALADALQRRGVGAGDRVAVLARNHPAFYELAFACSMLRATMVGVNWRLAAPEVAVILDDAAPRLVVVADEFRGNLPDGLAAELVGLEDDFEGLVGEGTRGAVDAAPAPDDVVYVLYTSGTTGEPKGVELTNRNMWFTHRIALAWEFDQDSVQLVAAPLFHIGGIGTGTMALMEGGRTVLLDDATPDTLVAAIVEHRITHAFFVPTLIQALTKVDGVEDADLSSLHLIIYGASPITDTVLRRGLEVFGCGFTHAYGMTEAAGTVICLPPADHDPEERPDLLRSCGTPFPWVEVRLVDPDAGEDVDQGDAGEVWLRGDNITPGYRGKPQETAEAITDDGWFRTGDAAYRDEDGYHYVFDRYKDMLVSGGENVYPAEIENALAEHDEVDEVAVVGVPHEKWGETPLAFVVAAAGSDLDEAQVLSFARERLAGYKCPSAVEFLDELPKNASGKLQKQELRAPYWQDADATRAVE